NGNQIWWNGGDGKGKVGLKNYTGTYLTATSTYASSTSGSLGPCCGVSTPAGSYGIFSSDSTHGLWQHDYASNMADSAYYLGACQQVCDMTMEYDHGQYSSLCLSSTNAGGYFLVQHNECDKNKTGLVNNSQNNDDWPSPQLGACDLGNKNEPQKGVLGTTSCTVWQYNNLHDNNDPDVPGNGIGGLAGGGPVGTGLILAGSSNITLYQNTIQHNNSWGELIVDLPDPESGAANCQGGTWVPSPVGVCYYPTYGNTSLDNRFASNGAYGNATNGDIGYAHTPFPNMPGSCFAGDRDPLNGKPNSATTDPPGIEGNPLYAPANGKGPCTQTNSGDMGPLVFEALCASQLLAPCPTIESVVCQLWPSSAGTCPLANFKPIPANYPRPDSVFKLTFPAPSLTPTMPNPCAGVPANPWCKASSRPVALSGMSAAPAAAVGVGIAAALAIGSRRRRRP
ncbi:MAG: hypothetical protein JOZ89_09810, partial [Gammaproteobacteria bacterium]|nr:hypothetical protein [Gammaproteobacteria bacterium]